MNKIIFIALLVSLAFQAHGKEILELKLASPKAIDGWSQTEHEGKPIWVNPNVEMNSEDIEFAELAWSQTSEEIWKSLTPAQQAEVEKQIPGFKGNSTRLPEIALKFTSKGTAKFAEITTKFNDQQLAVIYEGTILIAPRINEPIYSGRVVISGSFTKAEAQKIVSAINIKLKSNQRLEPIVKTPVDEVEAQGTQVHP